MKKEIFEKMPSKVTGIVKGLALRYGWEARLSRGMIWDIWEEIVGPQVAIHAWPERFTERDSLVVVVSDSVWMQQLCFQRQLFIDGLNARLPSGANIKDIRFVLGDVAEVRSRWTPHKIPKKDQMKKGEPQFPKRALDAAKDMMEPVRDQELRQAMTDLYLKYSEQKKQP
ncbi:MAG: DciA family protein [Thermodesulfobacteriota bacterium]|nr:DciA family protein [Thermodesulfobacteriota bacterium]